MQALLVRQSLPPLETVSKQNVMLKYQSNINVVVTGPGYLKCEKTFHIYIPLYKNPEDEKNMHTAIYECLKETENLGLQSIAFSALGTGAMNYEPNFVANALSDTVKRYNVQNPSRNIEVVVCVVYQDQMYQTFVAAARERARRRENEAKTSIAKTSGSTKVGKTHIKVLVGDLTQDHVNVLVHTCSHTLQLKKTAGLVTEKLNTARWNIQKELDNNYPNGLKTGDIAVTNGYGLSCKKVYHDKVLDFNANGKNDRPEKILFTFVTKFLTEANKYGKESIAFPALGTGILKFPSDIAASMFIRATQDFLQKHPRTSIRHQGCCIWKESFLVEHPKGNIV